MTHFILWKITPKGKLENDLRTLHPKLTGEEIQEDPITNGAWRMVGSSRLNADKILSIQTVAEKQLVKYKSEKEAKVGDRLQDYLMIAESVPEWFVPQ